MGGGVGGGGLVMGGGEGIVMGGRGWGGSDGKEWLLSKEGGGNRWGEIGGSMSDGWEVGNKGGLKEMKWVWDGEGGGMDDGGGGGDRGVEGWGGVRKVMGGGLWGFGIVWERGFGFGGCDGRGVFVSGSVLGLCCGALGWGFGDIAP
uniref:Uncharacterized protein n=1 Tax=Knipowitschia caucasica TaxID=637954 RepID=A0AAV2LMN9_KNICA